MSLSADPVETFHEMPGLQSPCFLPFRFFFASVAACFQPSSLSFPFLFFFSRRLFFLLHSEGIASCQDRSSPLETLDLLLSLAGCGMLDVLFVRRSPLCFLFFFLLLFVSSLFARLLFLMFLQRKLETLRNRVNSCIFEKLHVKSLLRGVSLHRAAILFDEVWKQHASQVSCRRKEQQQLSVSESGDFSCSFSEDIQDEGGGGRESYFLPVVPTAREEREEVVKRGMRRSFVCLLGSA